MVFQKENKYKFQKGHIPWNKGKEYSQIKREKHWNWKGGRIKTPSGYIIIHQPDHPNAFKINGSPYVLEHRLIMEKKIGRYLERWEVVHHKNSIRDDNRTENLELCPDRTTNTALDKLLQENKCLKEEIKKLKQGIK